jgi:DNA recombination protein RmuC
VQNNVVMATPTTLIALLRAVEYGWQQSEITKSAKKIHSLGIKLYEKLVTAQGHVLKLGSSLGNSVENYNKFIRSIEGKGGAFSIGRQLGSLVHADGELSEVKQLENDVNRLDSEEWSQSTFELAANSDEE